jgi:putative membrane protein
MMPKMILKIIVNAGALYLAHLWVNGVTIFFDAENALSTTGVLLLVGLVLWVGQAIVRPIIKLLTFPLIMLTFGLFTAVINILIIWGAALVLPQLEIVGLGSLIWTTSIVTVFNSIFYKSGLTK